MTAQICRNLHWLLWRLPASWRENGRHEP